jgi:hypothetical protein
MKKSSYRPECLPRRPDRGEDTYIDGSSCACIAEKYPTHTHAQTYLVSVQKRGMQKRRK